MQDLKAIFDANIELSEDEIVILLKTEGDLSIREAQHHYKVFATEAGLIKTSAQKKDEFLEALPSFDLVSTDGIAEAKEYGVELDITPVTVTKYIKTYAKEKEISIPVVSARSSSKWKEVVAGFTAEDLDNMSKEDVVEKINVLGEFDDLKKSASYYNRLRKSFGWEQPATMSSQLNDWFLNNLDATKEQIVETGIEIGMSEGSANYYVGVYKIVTELVFKLVDSDPNKAENEVEIEEDEYV